MALCSTEAKYIAIPVYYVQYSCIAGTVKLYCVWYIRYRLLFFRQCPGLPSSFFPPGLRTKPCVHFYSSPYVTHFLKFCFMSSLRCHKLCLILFVKNEANCLRGSNKISNGQDILLDC